MKPDTIHLGNLQLIGGDNGIGVSRFSGLGGAVPRQVRFGRSRRHGSVDRTRFYDGRLFEIVGHIKGLDDAEMWERFDDLKEQVALTDESLTLLRWRRSGTPSDEQAEVKIEGDIDHALDVTEQALLRFAMTLFAPDPRIYGATEKSGAYDPTTAGTGFGLTFPLTFDLSFPGESLTHLQVENQGRFPTPPVITLTGPVRNPIIENDTTLEFITTQNLDLLAGETLEINVDSRTVLLNGLSERPDLIDPSATTWWQLVKGVNLLRLNGQMMVTGQTELAVTFRDASI